MRLFLARRFLAKRRIRPDGTGTIVLPMNVRFRQLLSLLVPALVASSLAGCASINEKLANGAGDYIPQWAGGLPADAPPRPGTAKYDEYMKERERNRQLPADQRNAAKPDQTKPDQTKPGQTRSAPAQ
jgi:hypothetical protein